MKKGKDTNKKKIPKLYFVLTVIVILTCTLTIGGYVAYQVAGDYMFQKLVKSAGVTGGEEEVLGSIDSSELDFLDEGETAADKFNSISPEDKADAFALIKSKFTAAELADYLKMAAEGKTSEALKDVKAKLKERCTKEEMAQLKGWYNEYK